MTQHTSQADTDPVSKPIDPVFLEQARSLAAGGEVLPGGVEMLAKKLQRAAETMTPLRVKLGLDPTRPDLHLGHTVVLQKLRAFQDLGHQAILIIGDATAMIGDPSGRSQTRPPLTEEEVQVNAQTYLDQAGKVIDTRKAIIQRNSEWFTAMTLAGFLKMAANVTVAQILVREDFAKRYGGQQPIGLHELFYPLMQGYDSVMIDADIELGGTDQRFNNLMGRELQGAYQTGREPQMVLLMPLLEGTDGKIKMSKSYPEHCINITDPPEDLFGKVMSVPDSLLSRYELLLTPIREDQVQEQEKMIQAGTLNPRDVKARLGHWLVSRFYSVEDANQAEQAFINRFKHHVIPDEMPEATLACGTAYHLPTLMTEHAMADSKAEARRLIQGGGVKLDGEKITDPEYQLLVSEPCTQVLQAGKRRFLRLIIQMS